MKQSVSTRPMRIAFIGLRGVPANYSGIEVAVEETGARLAAKGHAVTVYCMADQPTGRPDQHRGMKLRYVPCLKGVNTRMISYASLATLDSLFRAYDVVHFHALGPATLSALPKLRGKRSIVTVHGLDWTHGKWGPFAKAYLKFGEWASAKFPHSTVVVSTGLRDYYQKQHGLRATYLPNGVTNSSPLALGNVGASLNLRKRQYLLFVGRLMPGKNVHQLIEAFRRVETDMKLVLVGGSAGKPEYEQLVQRLADEDDRVIVTGPVYGDAVRRLFANAYLFVLPSFTEGLPIALLEALSFGTPVLASDIPANMEALQLGSDQCGFTFPVGNVEALSSAIRILIENPSLAGRRAKLGRCAVTQKYNWDGIVDSLEHLYLSLSETKDGNVTYPPSETVSSRRGI